MVNSLKLPCDETKLRDKEVFEIHFVVRIIMSDVSFSSFNGIEHLIFGVSLSVIC